MIRHSAGQNTAPKQRLGTQYSSHNIAEEIPVEPRRLLGAYYTPDELATVLVEWALELGKGTVLDPSFGGCAFLNAATRVLADQGIPEPGRLVFGVDVEPSCLDYVRGNVNLEEKKLHRQRFSYTIFGRDSWSAVSSSDWQPPLLASPLVQWDHPQSGPSSHRRCRRQAT